MNNMKPQMRIEKQAMELLRKADAVTVPVPLERVTQYLQLETEAAALGDDVSGLLVITGARGLIGYNSEQSRVRQRFTVAHEVGHYVLHSDKEGLFIDKQYTAVFKRDQNSSTGEDLREIQANQFAAALLMPEDLLVREMGFYEF